MKFYFQLQILRIGRFFREASMHPVMGFSLCGLLFMILSILVFAKIEYAEFVYIGLALLIIASLNNTRRIDFLAGAFQRSSLYSSS